MNFIQMCASPVAQFSCSIIELSVGGSREWQWELLKDIHCTGVFNLVKIILNMLYIKEH